MGDHSTFVHLQIQKVVGRTNITIASASNVLVVHICCWMGNFYRHQIFPIFAVGLIVRKYLRNNHCYTVCVHTHQPSGQCPQITMNYSAKALHWCISKCFQPRKFSVRHDQPKHAQENQANVGQLYHDKLHPTWNKTKLKAQTL